MATLVRRLGLSSSIGATGDNADLVRFGTAADAPVQESVARTASDGTVGQVSPQWPMDRLHLGLDNPWDGLFTMFARLEGLDAPVCARELARTAEGSRRWSLRSRIRAIDSGGQGWNRSADSVIFNRVTLRTRGIERRPRASRLSTDSSS
jgi:hypothetical protein